MKELNWKQTNRLVIATVELENKTIKFKIDNRIVNYLVEHTPKVFFFKIKIDGKSEKLMANFAKLKPIVSKSSKLSVKIASKKNVQEENIDSGNYYSIARGESFMEKYLGVEGWQSQEYKFKLTMLDEKIDIEKQQKEKKVTTKHQVFKGPKEASQRQSHKINIKQDKTTTAKTEQESKKVEQNAQKCPYCQSTIPSDLDICPICFEVMEKAPDDVDFMV